jgi:hypothetical protein
MVGCSIGHEKSVDIHRNGECGLVGIVEIMKGV